MSKLTDKIKNLESTISDLQDELEFAEAKLTRQNFKRRRKQFRKKMQTDLTYKMLINMERCMYQSITPEPGTVIASFLDMLLEKEKAESR